MSYKPTFAGEIFLSKSLFTTKLKSGICVSFGYFPDSIAHFDSATKSSINDLFKLTEKL